MLITKQTLPRRTFLRGMGATLALPLLDAMVPAMSARAPGTPRFTAVYVGNGMNMWDWTPPDEGAGFELSPIQQPLEPFRNRTLVLSGLDNYPATDQGDTGGQHPRAAPAFMSSVHPKQTEGADVEAGTTVDQMIAELICRDSKLPSLEVSVDRNDVVGACDHGYACAYMNSLSWKTPTMPLPAETNPRFVFERLFGSGDTAEERQLRVEEDRSILDGLTREIAALTSRLGGHDRTKLDEYLGTIRDVEQRIVRAESTNSDFAVPERPVGVPETFREYAELMFDLQVLAFQADITRVTSFMLARENITRSYNEIGLPEAHHSMSHHGNNPDKMKDFTKLNTYHVDTLAYYLDRLQSIPDGDGTLLDGTVVLYGAGMSDGNIHNNYNVPVAVIGGPERGLQGNRHLVYPKGTPLANLSLSLMAKFGVQRGAVRRQHRASAAAVGGVGNTAEEGPRRHGRSPMADDVASSGLDETRTESTTVRSRRYVDHQSGYSALKRSFRTLPSITSGCQSGWIRGEATWASHPPRDPRKTFVHPPIGQRYSTRPESRALGPKSVVP